MFWGSDFTFLIFQKLRPKDRISLSYANKSIYNTQYDFLPDNTSFYVSDRYECIHVPKKRLNQIVKNPLLIIQNSLIITNEIIRAWIKGCVFHEIVIHIPSSSRFDNIVSMFNKKKCLELANKIVIDLETCCHDLPTTDKCYGFKFKRVCFIETNDTNPKFIPRNLFHSLHVENLFAVPRFVNSDIPVLYTICLSRIANYTNTFANSCKFEIIIDQPNITPLYERNIIPTGILIHVDSIVKGKLSIQSLDESFVNYLMNTKEIEFVDMCVSSFNHHEFDQISLICKIAPKLSHLIFTSPKDVHRFHSRFNLCELVEKYHQIRFRISMVMFNYDEVFEIDKYLYQNYSVEFGEVYANKNNAFLLYLRNHIIQKCIMSDEQELEKPFKYVCSFNPAL